MSPRLGTARSQEREAHPFNFRRQPRSLHFPCSTASRETPRPPLSVVRRSSSIVRSRRRSRIPACLASLCTTLFSAACQGTRASAQLVHQPDRFRVHCMHPLSFSPGLPGTTRPILRLWPRVAREPASCHVGSQGDFPRVQASFG